MEYAAIRHFADKRYCYALEKGRFLIRLETKKGDVEHVALHVQDKYMLYYSFNALSGRIRGRCIRCRPLIRMNI